MGLLSLPGGGDATSPPLLSKGIITGPSPAVTAVESFPHYLVNGANSGVLVSGRMHLTFWQAPYTFTITKFRTVSGGTAAAATPTLCRVGLYSVPDDWNTASPVTCVAACASDTALWANTFTVYDRALAANTVGGQAMPTSYQVVAGKYYATGILCVSAGAVPSFYATQYVMDSVSALFAQFPRSVSVLNSQTDLPLNTSLSALSNSTAAVYSQVVA